MSAYVDPSREQFEAFKALPRETPIHMLNLDKYREVADYPEGHPNHGKALSGREAYREYSRSIAPISSLASAPSGSGAAASSNACSPAPTANGTTPS